MGGGSLKLIFENEGVFTGTDDNGGDFCGNSGGDACGADRGGARFFLRKYSSSYVANVTSSGRELSGSDGCGSDSKSR